MFVKKIKIAAILGILAMLFVAIQTGCIRKTEPKVAPPLQHTVKVAAPLSLKPFLQAAASEFMPTHPTIKLSLSFEDPTEALNHLSQRTVNLVFTQAYADNLISPELSKNWIDAKLAVDRLVLICNEKSKLSTLSQKQLIDIYCKRTASWKGFTGDNEPISILSCTSESALNVIFKRYALTGFEEMLPKQQIVNSFEEVLNLVSQNPNAIAYVPSSLLLTSNLKQHLKTIPFENIEPSEENVVTSKYPLWFYIHAYASNSPTYETKILINSLIDKKMDPKLTLFQFILIPKMQLYR